jgi:multidrug efflux pump subunit AcrB
MQQLLSPFKVVIIFVFASVLGLLMIPHFSIDLNPAYTLPKLSVSYQLKGATPEIVESEVTAPLESALSQITGIKKIYSVSNQHTGTIELTFDKNVDIDFKKFEVSSIIRQVYHKLRQLDSYPQVEQRSREDDSKKALLLYKINSSFASYQIKKITEDIFINAVAQVKGVHEVSVYGASGIQVNVDYDIEKLKAHDIKVADIIDVAQKQFSPYYPGSVSLLSGQKILAKIENDFKGVQDIENLPIHKGDHFVLLKDIAKVFFEESKPRSYHRVNGLNSVTLLIYVDNNVNRLELASQLKKLVTKLKKKIPRGYSIELDYDDTEFLSAEIQKNFTRAGLSMAILLGFILVAYRNWRHLLILSLGIVVNLCVALLVAWFFKISIHLYTIAGITISFGLLIDNAVVVMDQLATKKKGTTYKAILGATLTTVMALLLVLLLPEEERQNLTEFCVIVSIELFCSIAVSIFYIPAVYLLVFKDELAIKKTRTVKSIRLQVKFFKIYYATICFLSCYKKTLLACLVLCFGLPVFLLPPKWEEHSWYNKTVGSQLYQEHIRPYSDKIFGGALRLFVRNVSEKSGYRDPQRTTLYIFAELPQGNSLEDMDQVMRYLEAYLGSVSGLEKYITDVSSGQSASIKIIFKREYENGSLPYQLKARLIAQSLQWGGVDWNIYGIGQGFSNGASESIPNFKVQLKGYNYDELARQSEIIATSLLEHKRIQKVNTNERLNWFERGMDQLVLDINRKKLSEYNLSPANVAFNLKERTENSLPSTMLNFQEQSIPVYIRPENGSAFSTFDVLHEHLNTRDANFKLDNSATLKKERTATAIHKEARQYIRQVSFDYYGSHQFGQKYLEKILAEFSQQLPPGYSAEQVSWSYFWEKSERQYSLLFLLVVGIYFISAVLFESLWQALHVIVSIPISFIGLFLAFSCFDVYFDQGGFAAFVLLGGLVVNATIFILYDFNLQNKKTNRVMVKVVAAKLRPITLTISSSCLGLVPFLIGGQNEIFWFALAAGTIGGLIVSLFAIVFVQPVMGIDKITKR